MCPVRHLFECLRVARPVKDTPAKSGSPAAILDGAGDSRGARSATGGEEEATAQKNERRYGRFQQEDEREIVPPTVVADASEQKGRSPPCDTLPDAREAAQEGRCGQGHPYFADRPDLAGVATREELTADA